MINERSSDSRSIRAIPLNAEIENPVIFLANILTKFQFLDTLAVFYEIGCEKLEVFTQEEISQAVDIAAQKQDRPYLRKQWSFLKTLIGEHVKKELSYLSKDSNSRFNSNKDLLVI
jgi:hypothetical protein